MRIALAQINTTVGDLSENKTKILSYIRQARERQAGVVVFPELSVTGYPPEDLLFKDHFIRENLVVLRQIAKEVKKMTAVVGFVDRDRKGGLYNAAAVIAGGGVKGIYHKHALPNYGVFDEKRYFKNGKGFPLFSSGNTTLAVNICEDLWEEKGVFQKQARDGASVFLNLSSSPYDFGKIRLREDLLSRRAKESKAHVCYVNLVGGQDELVFDGGSLIVDPRGKILCRAKQFEEDLLVWDLPDSSSRRKKKNVVVPPDFNTEKTKEGLSSTVTGLNRIERIYRALVLGTRDYIRKNGFQKAVIGLSGGIDSSVVAVIARDALGAENVTGISMPSRYSSEGTKSDARIVADNLGIAFQEIPIHDIFDHYLGHLKDIGSGQPSLALENIQARIRGNILMAYSNQFGWLVLTTGNKSEVAVGYCTLYRDMSGGFAVIKDVPKTKVFEIARFMNKVHGPVIPESILTRAPSAELRPDQKDQDTLPPYEVLDKIVTAYVEDHKSFADIKKMVKGPDADRIVREVIQMIDRSEYKRRQSPPGIKITPRAFGKDWRLPITNKYKEF